MFCTSPDYVGVCALVRLLCLSLIFFFDAVGSYSCLVALWNFLIGMCFEMFDFAHQLFDEKLIWGSRLIDFFFFFWDLQKTMFTTLKMVALWNCLIGMCFEMFDLAHQLFDEKPIWGSRLIDIFFLGPIEDHVYHP